MGGKAKACLRPPQMVGVRLEAGDLAVLDRLARVYGSRAQAVRFLLREVGAPYAELREEIAALRREVVALRAAVEQFGRVEVRPCEEERGAAGDDEAVRQVLNALLGMNRTARVD